MVGEPPEFDPGPPLNEVLGALTVEAQERWIARRTEANVIVLGMPEHMLARVRHYLLDFFGYEVSDE